MIEPIRTRFATLDPTEYALPADILERTLTPALVVYLDKVRENVRRVLQAAGGDPTRWRPHVKTSKIPEVFAEIARAGVRHFKCATTKEAHILCATLASEGIENGDVLVAYPLVGPALPRLGVIAAAHPETRVSVLVEDAHSVPEVPEDVSIFVDVNPGMDRTGIPVADRKAVLACVRAAGPRFRGLHYYDGHLHAGGPEARAEAVAACYEPLIGLMRELTAAGARPEEVITSGTPTFVHALSYAPLAELAEHGSTHRVSPGTVVYYDLRSEQENSNQEFLPAALVLARVVSHPAANLVTCDAGSKAIAAEAGDPVGYVLGHPELLPQTPNEEHLPLRVLGGERPARGEPLLVVPLHVCPTVNLAEEALVVDGGTVRLARVAARAHELWPDPPAR